MLSPDDAELVTRDPTVPGLALVLDDAALSGWLGGTVRRRYVRYKPGTAAVVGLELEGRHCFAVAHAVTAGGKLAKTVEKSPPGAVLTVDEQLRVLAGRPAADRDLPGVARLESARDRLLARALPGGDTSGELTVLAYKPQRRLVALLSPPTGPARVLRFHRPRVAERLLCAGLPTHGPPTPALLGAHRRAGLLVMSWLPGEELDRALRTGAAGSSELRAAGAALAQLHSCPTRSLPPRSALDDARELRQAARAVGVLVPALDRRAAALARRLTRELSNGRDREVTLHGDFSVDQVVIGPDGSAALVDLDAATTGEASRDLGSAVAAMLAGGAATGDPAAWAGDLLAGYAEHAAVSPRVGTQVAAGLLRRAVEPFRLGAPDWAERVESLLTQAEQRLTVRVGA